LFRTTENSFLLSVSTPLFKGNLLRHAASVARQNPVPPTEAAIGRRVRELREATRLTRVAFAREIESGISALANYEAGRVPLPFDVAHRICTRFYFSYAWLAEGKGDMRDYQPIVGKDVPSRSLFSEVYKAGLGSELRMRKQVILKFGRQDFKFPPGTSRREQLQFLLYQHLVQTMESLPDELRPDYFNEVIEASMAAAAKVKSSPPANPRRKRSTTGKANEA
jgi:transcriptional regulator with XRE-family HTH domain